jgi:DNA-binding protein HU-beta
MKKQEFIADVANRTGGLSRGQVEKVLDSLIKTVKAELKTDAQESRVPGMGTFKIVSKADRQGRNPKTGEELLIPAHKTLKFKVMKGF